MSIRRLLVIGRRWLPYIVAMAALIGVFFQYSQLHSSREAFEQRLQADHVQQQREIALGLWDTWDDGLDATTRDDVRKMCKWISSIPRRGSNTDKEEMASYRDWLTLFVKGDSVPASQYGQMLQNVPKHVNDVFLSGTGQDALTIQDVDRIRTSTIRMLNVMEQVAVAYDYEVADTDILDYAFKSVVGYYTKGLLPYIKCYRSDEQGYGIDDAWQPLTDLVIADDGRWHSKGEAASRQAESAAWEVALHVDN